MEILCPRCGKQLVSDLGEKDCFCSHCGSEITVVVQGDGFVLASATDQEIPYQKDIPVNDMIIEDYTKWQVGAIFSMIIGIVIMVLLGLQTFRDYSIAGIMYITKPRNLIFIGVGSVISIILLIGGLLVYRYVSTQKKNYINSLYHNQVDAKTSLIHRN